MSELSPTLMNAYSLYGEMLRAEKAHDQALSDMIEARKRYFDKLTYIANALDFAGVRNCFTSRGGVTVVATRSRHVCTVDIHFIEHCVEV